MLWEESAYWLVRFVFQRGLAGIYLIAFLVAAFQFRPLNGEDGLLPFTELVDSVGFREAPSLFHLVPTDRAVAVAAWSGVGLSLLAFLGLPSRLGMAAVVAVWGLLWLLYLSFVNVGRTFYGFGWESLLLETGFLAIFLGGAGTAAPEIVVWLLRWLLFRVMFGAGLIKIRGDPCWRDLTCMQYHYETQPMPNPLSWFVAKLPRPVHRLEVLINHIVELVVPFLYFAPQPIAGFAGLATIGFQGWLMLSGNFSWLNMLTAVLAVSTLSDGMLSALPLGAPATVPPGPVHQLGVYGLGLLVVALSYYPVRNMISSGQRMNASFDPVHLVNTYGAFGHITKERSEIVLEATMSEEPDEADWEAYRFKGKPTDVSRLLPQWAPYHLRLDWQMWFAAMSSPYRNPWFLRMVEKLLDGDEDIRTLLAEDPFDGDPPERIRARLFRYEFTDIETWQETGDWWEREAKGTYLQPVAKDDAMVRSMPGRTRRL